VDGLRVTLRMIISADAEQRFDANGVEVLQLRGAVVDDVIHHPPLVVRFRGQRRAELYRWAKANKHLTVEGSLEVKTWSGRDGRQHIALLVEAANIFPLSDAEPAKAGIYSTALAGPSTPVRPRSTKAQQMDMLRRMMDRDDG
jgi:hypothetical protein